VKDTNQPMRVVQVDQSARHQVLLIDYIGAVGDSAKLIGLSTDGSLRLISNPQGRAQTILTAADLGCATQSGNRLFVEGALGRGEPGAASGLNPGYGISRSYYQISGNLQMRFVGYQGTVVPQAPASDPYDNYCTGNLPSAGPLTSYATSAQQALAGVLAAASSKDETRASAFIGGGYADFLNVQYLPDVWEYLTATKGLNPAGWLNRPANCTSASLTNATCTIIGPGGEPLNTEEQDVGSNWVVTGAEAG
jgi:hypothetical protein